MAQMSEANRKEHMTEGYHRIVSHFLANASVLWVEYAICNWYGKCIIQKKSAALSTEDFWHQLQKSRIGMLVVQRRTAMCPLINYITLLCFTRRLYNNAAIQEPLFYLLWLHLVYLQGRLALTGVRVCKEDGSARHVTWGIQSICLNSNGRKYFRCQPCVLYILLSLLDHA